MTDPNNIQHPHQPHQLHHIHASLEEDAEKRAQVRKENAHTAREQHVHDARIDQEGLLRYALFYTTLPYSLLFTDFTIAHIRMLEEELKKERERADEADKVIEKEKKRANKADEVIAHLLKELEAMKNASESGMCRLLIFFFYYCHFVLTLFFIFPQNPSPSLPLLSFSCLFSYKYILLYSLPLIFFP
jgi:hypothetical protein